MVEVIQKNWNGRKIKELRVFESCSMDGHNPIALYHPAYSMPFKWHNFKSHHKANIAGVMISENWRNGSVKILLF